MPVPASSRGLRERKKLQTRLAIRREAFRLFDEQEYANNTVEQIAAAAEVSPRTFYRYFGVKEALLISDDQISPIVEAFAAAPTELDPVAAYRYAVAAFFGELSQDDRDDAVAGQRLMYEVPEVRGLLYSAYVRLIDLIAEALVRRGDPTDELGRRVVAGAIVGVLIAASHNTPLPEDALLRSLSILEDKLS